MREEKIKIQKSKTQERMKMSLTNPSDAFHQWMTLTLSNIKLQLIKLTGHSLNQVRVIIPTRKYFNLYKYFL